MKKFEWPELDISILHYEDIMWLSFGGEDPDCADDQCPYDCPKDT